MTARFHSDQPIATPEQDSFGVDPFASAIASSLLRLNAPNGSVIAINGPWGSGKSSAVNLVRHHLANAMSSDEIVLINFNCWWFRGEDALALAFFRELYSGLSPSLGEKIKKILPKLGARLLRAGSALGGAADAVGAGGLGAATGGVMKWLGDLIEQDEGVEKLHGEISKVLSEQKKRFLVIIDDIDRLSPDEALLIFRLVKSVGRLPNVMYLLVYDRQLAEKIVSERYPSEGPHYLEKIVQAAFELPEPSPTDIQDQLLAAIESICGLSSASEMVRFMNIFYEGISPAMRTPRDIARFSNSLSVTWPSVAGNVNSADFVMLEVFRLMRPTLYRAIQQNKAMLCQSASISSERDAAGKRFRLALFGPEAVDTDQQIDRVLMRLFPVLESAWANRSYDGAFARTWAQQRRVCSESHFDSYFRFSVAAAALPSEELDELIQRAGDVVYVSRALRDAALTKRRGSGTKAGVILDELINHADRIEDEDTEPLLRALFSVADEIDTEADRGKGFSFRSNTLRLHWLLRRLLMDKALATRSSILRRACASASIAWLADFTRSAWGDYHPSKDEAAEPPEKCLTTEVDANELRTLLHERIISASKDGALVTNKDLLFLLSWWSRLAEDDGKAARTWVADLMSNDDAIRNLAKAFTSYEWSTGFSFGDLGDSVAKRTTRVHKSAIEKYTDPDTFRARAAALSVSAGEHELIEFLDAWRRADEGEDD